MIGGGAQNRTELNLEQPRHLQRDANRPPSEERIILARDPQVGRILVGADIERANRDRALAERLEHLAVKRQLLSLVGKILVGQEREFRPQQADAFGAVAHRQVDIGGQRDIREHLDAMAVAGRGGRVAPFDQLALKAS